LNLLVTKCKFAYRKIAILNNKKNQSYNLYLTNPRGGNVCL
jgi:hypothetical protein